MIERVDLLSFVLIFMVPLVHIVMLAPIPLPLELFPYFFGTGFLFDLVGFLDGDEDASEVDKYR